MPMWSDSQSNEDKVPCLPEIGTLVLPLTRRALNHRITKVPEIFMLRN